MDNTKQMEECEATIRIKPLPADLLGRSLRKLSVIDRLWCERVSPRWKWIVREFGWSEMRELDHIDVVLEGTTPENGDRFLQRFFDSTGEICNLATLLNRVSSNLVVLNLVLVDRYNISWKHHGKFVLQIAESLQTMKKLEKLNMGGFELADFIAFLPSSLRRLWKAGYFTIKMVEKFSQKCPNLEEFPFDRVEDVDRYNVGELIRRFPRLKELNLSRYSKFDKLEEIAFIAELKELETLILPDLFGFDADSFEAMVNGCTKLRKLRFAYISSETPLTEASFFHLAKLPYLTVLEMGRDFSELFTDSVLKEIAKQGKLKRLDADFSALTDESILYLIDRCKSLVSLDLASCAQITERSLKAVIREVHRRHGSPPGALPTDPLDSGIFFFDCRDTGISENRALEMASGNPWLALYEIDGQKYDYRKFV